jgi:hypothetical protein
VAELTAEGVNRVTELGEPFEADSEISIWWVGWRLSGIELPHCSVGKKCIPVLSCNCKYKTVYFPDCLRTFLFENIHWFREEKCQTKVSKKPIGLRSNDEVLRTWWHIPDVYTHVTL